MPYAQILNSNGDIAKFINVDGPQTVTLKAGQHFETHAGVTWTKIDWHCTADQHLGQRQGEPSYMVIRRGGTGPCSMTSGLARFVPIPSRNTHCCAPLPAVHRDVRQG